MIQIQIAAIERLSTVLAGISVALEDIVTREFDFLLREPIKQQQ
jgi:hypothetical protein